MRLITGPAGSGKTALVLDRLRESLRADDCSVRLLVPTATMAQHLQNRLAREGFVFRAGLIQTLSRFVEGFGGAAPQVPAAVLYLLVEEALRRVNRPEFAEVARLPGFSAALARTMEEFSSAGCDSARLSGCLPDTPLGAAFLAVHREVDRELERRGLAMRARRLERTAARIESEGMPGVGTIWMDGFHALPDPELKVIHAMGGRADLTLTLSDTDAAGGLRARLVSMGFVEERAPGRRPAPSLALVKAAGIEREADEIARRILEQAAAGRPFREMAIIVRAPELYAPVFRATLGRFGIPARFYFDEFLEEHAVTRFLCGAVEAMLAGWDHAATLAVVRLAPRFADSMAMDRFEFEVREQIPNAGLGALKALLFGDDGHPLSSEAERLIRFLDSLSALEEWRSFALLPKDWAARFRTLRNLFRPAAPSAGADRELALAWRSQAAALRVFDEALAEAALALDPARETELEDFWRAVKSVLRLKPLRLDDRRRNVVHVLGAHEARQWSLPVAFICGMVEKQFPRLHTQDPFFPDAARRQLNAAGVRVRTAADFEREERALFDSAITRATSEVALSRPEFDERGESVLPSVFLEGLALAPEAARAVKPRPRYAPVPPGPPAVRTPDLLDWLRARTEKLSPTGLEQYLQCPFQYFGSRTLRLETQPARPAERLDHLTQGDIVHAVLKEWIERPQPVEALFESVWERCREERRIPSGYHTERLRNAMLEDVLRFVESDPWPRDRFQARTEEKFSFALADSVQIAGKIDRLDTAPDGRAYVIDYKYSAAAGIPRKLEDPNLLQAPLYLAAAQRSFGLEPAGMFYAGLKGGVRYAGWAEGESPMKGGVPFPENWLEQTGERALAAVAEIRSGRVEPFPANIEKCEYCDFRDVCRVAASAEAEEAEGA